MRQIICFLMGLSLSISLSADGLIDDLRLEIDRMQEESIIKLEYTFEGCFGPYHHGSIVIEKREGMLSYLTKSFNHKNEEGISQAGSYEPAKLISILMEEAEQNSSSVFGNSISYRLSRNGFEVKRGVDRIEQRHFIAIFEPFTSIFPKEQKDIVPKLSSGGFVH